MQGEDLGPLGVDELQNLEKQLDRALVKARERKVIGFVSSMGTTSAYIHMHVVEISIGVT